ncbi:16S rRNA (uracil(1498)-N(3))-methyltransferase [Deinobacterium chartae]|nr:16S rRNA (uracil(1498)-N(3))-methyltransferase [Deinobacterium chartae]
MRVEQLESPLSVQGKEVRHLHVLRLKPGDTLAVFDGQGLEAEARIVELAEFSATLELGEAREVAREHPQAVTLAVALLKGDKLSDVVRQATELGAARIQLLQTRYADVPDIGDNKLSRLRRVAEEAAKQSRRAVVPEVLAPVPLARLPEVSCGFVAHPGSGERLLDHLDWSAEVWLASGPEGGFSEAEIELLRSRGYRAITLGPRILRAETAPVALLGAIAATGV